jgi:CRISPR system Cascade subunit CasC
MTTMLIEFHLLQNHAPSNLNRDDTGSPKEALFGGLMRARISSQCLKRSLRRSEIFQEALAGHLASRSRQMETRLRPELERLGCSSDVVSVIVAKATALGSGKESEDGETRQTMFLAGEEIARLAADLKSLHDEDPSGFAKLSRDDLEKQLANSSLPRSVDIALFGRMTTSPAFEDVQAAMQVAHAISTSKVSRQYDYYTAVDDLNTSADDLGADMIGDTEFNSATYYKYFSLDWTQLLTNLGGDEQVARRALLAFLNAAALTTPTGKQNSFAAHNPPDAILVEVKNQRVPISYANAFVKPVQPHDRSDLVQASLEAFTQYVAVLKSSYGLNGRSFWLTTRENRLDGATPVQNLEELGRAVLASIPVGQAVG